jgi:hypothetical protein
LDSTLKGVSAVKHAGRQLEGVRGLVDKMVEEEFQKICLNYVTGQPFRISGRVAEAIKNEETNPAQYFESNLDEEKLRDLISNKIRVKSL